MECKSLFLQNTSSVLTNDSYEYFQVDDIVERLLWGFDDLYIDFITKTKHAINEAMRDRSQQERQLEHITDPQQLPSTNGGRDESDLGLSSHQLFPDHSVQETGFGPAQSDSCSSSKPHVESNVAPPPAHDVVGKESRLDSVGHGTSRPSLEHAITKSEHEDAIRIDVEENPAEQGCRRESKTNTEVQEKIE